MACMVTGCASRQHPSDGIRATLGYQVTPTVHWSPRGKDNAPEIPPRTSWLSQVDLGAAIATGGNEWVGYGLGSGMTLALGDEVRVGGFLEPTATLALLRGTFLMRTSIRAGLKPAVGRVGQIDVELAKRWQYEGRLEAVVLFGPFTIALGGGLNQHLDPILGANLSISLYNGAPKRSHNTTRPPPRHGTYVKRGPGLLDLAAGLVIAGGALYIVYEIVTSDLFQCAMQAGDKVLGPAFKRAMSDGRNLSDFKAKLSQVYADGNLNDTEANKIWAFLKERVGNEVQLKDVWSGLSTIKKCLDHQHTSTQ